MATSDHYLVKFKWGKETLFGVCENYSDEAKEAAKRGNILVAHAVLPKGYEVPLSDITDIPLTGEGCGTFNPKTQEFEGGDEYHQYIRAEEKKAQELSDSKGDGVVVGKLFRVGVGDGYAFYVVTKVNKQTCRIEWRGFALDRWVDQRFGYGGSVRLQDVAHYCRRPLFR